MDVEIQIDSDQYASLSNLTEIFSEFKVENRYLKIGKHFSVGCDEHIKVI